MLRSGVAEAHKDNRRAPRQRAFLTARLVYPDGSVSVEGLVTQISEIGAKINLAEDVNLPERFRVEIPQRRLQREARLVRRDADSVAVAFETEPKPAALDAAALLPLIDSMPMRRQERRERGE